MSDVDNTAGFPFLLSDVQETGNQMRRLVMNYRQVLVFAMKKKPEQTNDSDGY